MTIEQITSALKLPEIVVGEAVDNTAQEGATFSGEFMWGKNALLIQVPERPGRRVPAAGYTFVWDMIGNGLTTTIENIREENRDRMLMKGKHAFDQKLTSSDLGFIFLNAVA